MGIQTTGGNIVIDSDDLQFTHRGKTIAVKVRILEGVPYIMGCIKGSDGSWQANALLDDETFVNTGVTPETELAKYGSAREWVRKVVLPLLQGWLDALFPSTSVTQPKSALEQIAAELSAIKLIINTDGTVTATL
jgi:hypothetical protein